MELAASVTFDCGGPFEIKWEVEDAPGDAVASPLVSDVPSGTETSFNVPLSRDIGPWPSGHGKLLDQKALVYRVRAYVETDDGRVESAWRRVGQDESDVIRQEYLETASGPVPRGPGTTEEVLARELYYGFTSILNLGSTDGSTEAIRMPFLRATVSGEEVAALSRPGFAERIRARWECCAAFGELLANVGMLYDRGVVIVLGTDTGNSYVFPGYSVHRELELLVRAGLTTADWPNRSLCTANRRPNGRGRLRLSAPVLTAVERRSLLFGRNGQRIRLR